MVYMISVEAETPQILWKRQINGEPSSPLVHDIDEEKVYFGVQSEGKSIFYFRKKLEASVSPNKIETDCKRLGTFLIQIIDIK